MILNREPKQNRSWHFAINFELFSGFYFLFISFWNDLKVHLLWKNCVLYQHFPFKITFWNGKFSSCLISSHPWASNKPSWGTARFLSFCWSTSLIVSFWIPTNFKEIFCRSIEQVVNRSLWTGSDEQISSSLIIMKEHFQWSLNQWHAV